jgi:NAD-dependent DNA ligase
MNAVTLIRAHQYLYYVNHMPVLTDSEYDDLCKKLGVDGKGGSDCEDHYTEEERRLASELRLKNCP